MQSPSWPPDSVVLVESNLLRERRAQSTGRLEEVLGQHLHVAEHGHEARVAVPAWDDMQVEMVDDPGAGCSTEVPAEVETVWRVLAAQRSDAVGGQPVDVERLLVGELDEVGDVAAWR